MRVAMYLRLSSEDGDLKDTGKAESESISNQRGLLQNFISSPQSSTVGRFQSSVTTVGVEKTSRGRIFSE